MLFEQDELKNEWLSHQLPRNGCPVGSPLHLFTFSLFPSFHLLTFPIFSPFHLFTFSPFLSFHLFTFPIFSPLHLFTFSPFLSFHLFTLPIFSPFHLFTFSPFHPPFKQQGRNNISKGNNCAHAYDGDGSKRM